ncbi:uncharacterized protein [Onthophagus taurus]|uniref:uncharacterized protein n=1 Tax=Onthophagus taurus TaxID=166361 RepID=UPI0039BE5F49
MYYLDETKLEIHEEVEEKFEYVVEREEQKNVCFGSSQRRKTGFVDGGKLSKCGPGSYNIKSGIDQFLNKVRSKRGVPGLANCAPRSGGRTEQTPSPTRYDPEPERPPRHDGAAPFDIKCSRGKMFINKNPGPGTYTTAVRKCRRTRLNSNFGKPTVIPTVEEVCIPTAVDTCIKCSRVCEGDYWQNNHTVFLCQCCMAEEVRLHEVFNKEELRNFIKMRNCFYMHRHDGTTAAIRLLSNFQFFTRHKIENYLDLYIKCY